MNVLDAADILWETGSLLSLTKAWKSRGQSYTKAARLAEDLELDWVELPTRNPEEWESLPEEVQEAYTALTQGESLPLHDELLETHGNQAADIMRVRGVGPAMAQKIQKTLDIWTVEQLDEAAQSGQLLEVSGIGPKTLEQLKTQIEITKETLAARADKHSKLGQKAKLKQQVANALDQIGHVPQDSATTEEPATKAEAEVTVPPTKVSEPQAAEPTVEPEPTEAAEEIAEPVQTTALAEQEDPNQSVVRHPIGDVLRSPISHKVGLQQNGSCVEVPGTSERYPVKAGIIDLMAKEEASTTSLFQKIMEAPVYSRFYEEVFRPGFTRVLTNRTAAQDIDLSIDMLAAKPDWGVLDVACGTGNYARAIAKQLDPARGFVLAMDVSWPMLERASLLRQKEGLRHVHLVRGDALALPISDEILEAVHCTAAFHLLPDPDKALREFYRVTRQGGRLVIGTFLQAKRKRFFPVRLAQKYASPLAGFRWFDQRELEQRIRNAGFSIQRADVHGLAISISAEKR